MLSSVQVCYSKLRDKTAQWRITYYIYYYMAEMVKLVCCFKFTAYYRYCLLPRIFIWTVCKSTYIYSVYIFLENCGIQYTVSSVQHAVSSMQAFCFIPKSQTFPFRGGNDITHWEHPFMDLFFHLSICLFRACLSNFCCFI